MTRKPVDEILGQLRAKAEAATPGPWMLMKDGFGAKASRCPTVYATDDDLRYVAKCADGVTFHTETDNLSNAAHIVAFNPKQALELLAIIRRQGEALESILLPQIRFTADEMDRNLPFSDIKDKFIETVEAVVRTALADTQRILGGGEK